MAYSSLIERTKWTLRRFDVPVLPPGTPDLSVLHISDIHMTAGQRSKQAWLRSLDDLDPDLVVCTGDNLAGFDAVPPTLAALGPLLRRPGVFVLGSNDYYAPRAKNPLKYFWKNHKRVVGVPLPWEPLRDGFVAAGWRDLTNSRDTVSVGGHRIAVAGVDDPHLKRDHYERIAGPAEPEAVLRLALSHSPEPRVLDRFAADGYDLILCGHTHGGQLRVPFYGALVTNCGIDRERSRWLHRWDRSYLHVSAGLGTSPYAPYRFACPPEASLLTLTARTG